MHLKIIVFFNFFSVANSYCMSYMKRVKGCPKQPNIQHSTLPITECLDICMRNEKVYCNYVQWKQESSQCFTSKRLHTGGRHECIVFGKLDNCRHTPDFTCLRSNSKGQVDEHALGFEHLATEGECQSLCLLSDKCYSYVWDTQELYCRLQMKRGKHHYRKQNIGEVYKEKMTNCTAGRCAYLRTHPGKTTLNYRFDVISNTTVYDCLKTILRRKDRYALQWDTKFHECHLYKNRIDLVSRPPQLPWMIEVTESKTCNDRPRNTQEVCIKKVTESRSRGGLELSLTEDECVDFCKLIVNCAAVDWDVHEKHCIFHFYNTALIQQAGWTHYQVVLCPVTAEYRIYRNGFIFAFYTKTSKKAINHRNQLQQRAFSCIKCACLCRQAKCNGFECDEINGCETRNVHNVMDLPIKHM